MTDEPRAASDKTNRGRLQGLEEARDIVYSREPLGTTGAFHERLLELIERHIREVQQGLK